MHAEALAFVKAATADLEAGVAVDLGGRNINGSVKTVLPGWNVTAVDIMDGPGVDEVGDAASWGKARSADLVTCCEVLEHTPDAEAIVANAARLLRKGGLLVITAACDPRRPHSSIDGHPLRSGHGEFYENIDPELLTDWCDGLEDVQVQVHEGRGDVYLSATKG